MVIHISLIGQEDKHVFEGVKDKQFGTPDKLYLLHSPNQKISEKEKKVDPLKGQFKTVAKNVQKKLEGICDTFLIEINAFNMNSVWDAVNQIIKDERKKDDSLNFKDFAINITGGTNLMAVAGIIAAGTRGIRAYYVLNKKFKENKPPYVRELNIPNFRREKKIDDDLTNLLDKISQQEFRWSGVNPKPRNVEKENGAIITCQVRVNEDVRTHWLEKRFEKGWIVRKELLGIMKEKHKVPRQTTANRLETLKEKGFIVIRENFVPELKSPSEGSLNRYSKFVYRINKKETMIIITSNGTSELKFKKKRF